MDSISSERSAGQAGTASAGVEPVISVRGLVKRYDSYQAVAGIDLEVRHGEIFAFLGPNGAGKTTTVEILEGFRRRTAGEVSVLGQDPATAGGAWRERVGVVLQESEPEPGLSVRECLAMYAGYYRKPRDIDQTIALVGLTAKAGTLGTRLSGGQRRRLDFALALIGDPELIFLDEPTTGFDPSARRAAWEVVAGLRKLGKTIFLTTHYMDEAEYLADRIMVLSAGHIVAEGTPRTLGGRDHMSTAISFTLPGGLAPRDLPAGLSPLAEPGAAGLTIMHTESPLVHLQMLSDWALGRGFDLPDLDVHRPTLELGHRGGCVRLDRTGSARPDPSLRGHWRAGGISREDPEDPAGRADRWPRTTAPAERRESHRCCRLDCAAAQCHRIDHQHHPGGRGYQRAQKTGRAAPPCRKRWRRSAGWLAAWRTISITCSPSSTAIAT